ncbi:MAG: metallopeptidase family protein [Candidatus Aminicenantales bacterium]
MDRQRFEAVVEEALASLPEKFRAVIENLVVLVEDRPARKTREEMKLSPLSSLLGLYHGVPLKHRGPFYGNVPPDVIVIYREPIEALCSSEEEVREKVREVVEHEIGHHFGLTDKDLKDIEVDGKRKEHDR